MKIISCFSMLALLFGVVGCGQDDDALRQPQAHPAFYHWKSTLQWDKSAQRAWDNMGVQTMYLRLFDVKWVPPRGATPVAVVEIDGMPLPSSVRVVPVVFITNEVFHQSDTASVVRLAQQIAQKIRHLARDLTYDEVQIDCDWSGGTRSKYFRFLEVLSAQFPDAALSATIRLHQVTYREKTGIPPIQRGMLMPYNLDNPTLFSARNSIYDPDESGRYLAQQPTYPLPLDVAMPLFSWGVHFRGPNFQGFLHGLTPAKAEELAFLTLEDGLFYRVGQDTVFQGQYLRVGDYVKVEAVEYADMETLLQQTLPILPNDTFYLAFFHWDKSLLDAHPARQLRRLVND